MSNAITVRYEQANARQSKELAFKLANYLQAQFEDGASTINFHNLVNDEDDNGPMIADLVKAYAKCSKYEMKPYPCKYCGFEHITIQEICYPLDDKKFFGSCRKCGVSGPIEKSKQNAFNGWQDLNHRVV